MEQIVEQIKPIMATENQIRAIKNLARAAKVDLQHDFENMTKHEASRMIDEFKVKLGYPINTNYYKNGNSDYKRDIRLGMCTKLVHEEWLKYNLRVNDNPNAFITDVRKFYKIICRIMDEKEA